MDVDGLRHSANWLSTVMVGGVLSAKAAGAIKPTAMHVMTRGFKEINLVIIYPFTARATPLPGGSG